MRTTRSGTVFSPFDEEWSTEIDVEGLVEEALCQFHSSRCDEQGERAGNGLDIYGDGLVHSTDDTDKDCWNIQDEIGADIAQHTLTRAEKNTRRRQEKRRKRRNEAFLRAGHPVKHDSVNKIMQTAEVISADIERGELENLPSSSCGYQAKREGIQRDKSLKTLEDIIKEGYTIIPWDGRTSKLFTHGDDKRIFAVCVGQAFGDGWKASCDDAYDAFKETYRDTYDRNGTDVTNPRGNYRAILTGINHGRGSQEPHNIAIDKNKRVPLEKLRNRQSIKRIASFASASFQMFAPRLYNYYHTRMVSLSNHRQDLRRPFASSIFACAGFNIGPQVATFMHRDCMNCPFGWCSIHALGPFDSKTGGHMILEDLRVAIEFPSGSLMLLPSATLKHGNTKIRDGEDRASFTQFTPGNLFRFIDCGFKTEKSLKGMDQASYQELMEGKKNRWEDGVRLWSTMKELQSTGYMEGQSH